MFDHEKLDAYRLSIEFVAQVDGILDELECAACLDVLVVRQKLDRQRAEPGKATLVRIVATITKLIERLLAQPSTSTSTSTSTTRRAE